MNWTPSFRTASAGSLLLTFSLACHYSAQGATLSLPLMGGASSQDLVTEQNLTLLDISAFSGAKGTPPPVQTQKPKPAVRETPPAPRPKPRPTPSSDKPKPKPRPEPEPPSKPSGGKPKPRPVEQTQEPEPEPDTTPDLTSGKETDLTPPPPVPAASPAILFLSTGYYNKVYFRGLDILDRVSPDSASSGASSTVIKLVKGRFEAGLQYIQALDQQLPDGSLLDQDPNAVDRNGNRVSRNEDFRIPSRERYAELDAWLRYTQPVIPGKLDADFGITNYRFSDKNFWGIRNATELQTSLTWNGFKYAVPGVTYAWDFNGFEGSYLEFSLAGRNLPSYRNGDFGISLQPYARTAYDFKYNGDNNGWNNFEAGLNVPINLNKYLIVNLTANYSADLGDRTGGGLRRTDDGFWAGISIGTGTTLSAFNKRAEERFGKDVMPLVPPPATKWAVHAGIGTRTISADFRNEAVLLTPALNVVRREQDLGTLAIGDDNLHYKDGSIGTDKPGFGADPSGLAPYSGGRKTGTAENKDEQVLFSSDRYVYTNRAAGDPVSYDDNDTVVYPYISLDYDLGQPGGFSAGIRYSFTGGEFDSGINRSGLDRADETYTRHLFLYDVSNLAPDGTLVYDAGPLGALLGDRSPQKGQQVVRTEKAKVVTFLRSSLDVDLHSIAIPLEYTVDLGDRAHLSLSVGPTFNLFNTNLQTTAWSRELNNLAGGRLLANDANFKVRKGALSGDFVEPDTGGKSKPQSNVNPVAGNSPGGGVNTSASSTAGANVAAAPGTAAGANAAAANRAGVKGGTARGPQLPGTPLATRTWSNREQHFAFGAAAQATVRWDLDEADRWFIELWGRYDYADPFTVSNPVSSVEVDASSWGVGAGVGFRF